MPQLLRTPAPVVGALGGFFGTMRKHRNLPVEELGRVWRGARSAVFATVKVVGFLLLTTCAKQESASVDQKLTVFAASSLVDVFSDLKASFERDHAACEVLFNFAGSHELRTQIEQGSNVDVLAVADETHMHALVQGGFVAEAQVFAENEPVLLVARQETQVTSFAALPRASRIVVGVPEVPIGRYTARILDNADAAWGGGFRSRVQAKVVSQEFNVRQVLAKLNLGEASAGFVYRSDTLGLASDLAIVPIPPAFNVVAKYSVAALRRARQPKLARAWLHWITSKRAEQAFLKFGFIPRGAGGG